MSSDLIKLDKDRRKLLEQLADQIMKKIMNKGITSFENVSDDAWDDAFMETLHPLLDEAVSNYRLGAHDVFYMGVWFGSQIRM